MTRRVLVTGGNRGIGQHISTWLARAGFDVVVHCHVKRDAADAVAKAIQEAGGRAQVLQFDVGDREQAAAALTANIEVHGAFYGVVCNAGNHRDNAFPAMSADDWDLVLRTNLDAFYNVLHPVTMPMVKARQGGRIVVISSVAGLVGNRGQVNYSAAKGGLIAASKALAVELAKRRITVNCIAPGIIETDMTAELDQEQLVGLIPARRMGRPEEVASLVAYLFTPEAEYITRQVISVNGGMV
jgi:3-oxoacyl-[acyl-carrier protein] reductase